MASLINTSTTSTPAISGKLNQVRAGLTLAGVVIAVLCSLALVKDAQAAGAVEGNEKESLLTGTAARLSADQFSKVRTVAVVLVTRVVR